MKSYFSANVWDKNTKVNKPPHTSKKAHPVQYELVKDAVVIHVVDARYRNATLSGKFVLSPFVLPFPNKGTGKIDVLCRWFDHRLTKTGLTLKVDYKKVRLIKKYSGEVISDIGK